MNEEFQKKYEQWLASLPRRGFESTERIPYARGLPYPDPLLSIMLNAKRSYLERCFLLELPQGSESK